MDAVGVDGNLELSEMYSRLNNNPNYSTSPDSWPQLIKVNAIELTTAGVKTEYEKGESFNPLGLTVKGKYSNSNKAKIELDHFGVEFSEDSFSSLGAQEITVKSYGGYEETFNVLVVCKHPSPTKVMGTEASCTATGLTDGLYCSDCGIWLEEQMTVDKNNDHTFGDWTNHDAAQHKKACACGAVEYGDHVWGKGVETTPPTETSEGIMTYTCGICGGAKTEPIQKLHTPTIKVGSYTAMAGETFTVEVRIENNIGFAYLEVKPTYSAELSLVSVENGDLISDFTKGSQYIWIADEDVTADGLLLTMTIQVNETAEAGEYSVGFTVRTCGNYDEQNVTMAVIPGTITVVPFVYGDATDDGNVNGFDIIRLKKYLANYNDETGTSTVEIGLGADATGDGNVNGFDIIRLKKYLANYDDETGSSTVVLGPAK